MSLDFSDLIKPIKPPKPAPKPTAQPAPAPSPAPTTPSPGPQLDFTDLVQPTTPPAQPDQPAPEPSVAAQRLGMLQSRLANLPVIRQAGDIARPVLGAYGRFMETPVRQLPGGAVLDPLLFGSPNYRDPYISGRTLGGLVSSLPPTIPGPGLIARAGAEAGALGRAAEEAAPAAERAAAAAKPAVTAAERQAARTTAQEVTAAGTERAAAKVAQSVQQTGGMPMADVTSQTPNLRGVLESHAPTTPGPRARPPIMRVKAAPGRGPVKLTLPGVQLTHPVEVPVPGEVAPVTLDPPAVTPFGVTVPHPTLPTTLQTAEVGERTAAEGAVGAGKITQWANESFTPATTHAWTPGLRTAVKNSLIAMDEITSPAYLADDPTDLLFRAQAENTRGLRAAAAVEKELQKVVPRGQEMRIAGVIEGTAKGPVTAAEENAAATVREIYDTYFKAAEHSGIDVQFKNNYLTLVLQDKPEDIARFIDKVTNAEALAAQKMPAPPGTMGTAFRFSWQRNIDTIAQARAMGLHPIQDPAQLVRIYQNALTKSITQRRLVQQLQDITVQVDRGGEKVWVPLAMRTGEEATPSSYVRLSSGAMKGYSIVPEYANAIDSYFSALGNRGGAMTGIARGMNGILKPIIMWNPTFHGKTLMSAAATATPMMSREVFTNNPLVGLVRSAHRYKVDDPIIDEAISHGLNQNAWGDVSRGLMGRIDDYLKRKQEIGGAIGTTAGAGRAVIKAPVAVEHTLHEALWTHVARNLQLHLYDTVKTQLVKKWHIEPERAARIAADQANRMMGNVPEWMLPKVLQQYGDTLMFARNYTYGQFSLFGRAVGRPMMGPKMGVSMALNPSEHAAVVSLNRGMFARAIVQKFLFANAMQYGITGKLAMDNPAGHKGDVWTGKTNERGDPIYVRFKEWTDDLANLTYEVGMSVADGVMKAGKLGPGRSLGDYLGQFSLQPVGRAISVKTSPAVSMAQDLARDYFSGKLSAKSVARTTFRETPFEQIPGLGQALGLEPASQRTPSSLWPWVLAGSRPFAAKTR